MRERTLRTTAAKTHAFYGLTPLGARIRLQRSVLSDHRRRTQENLQDRYLDSSSDEGSLGNRMIFTFCEGPSAIWYPSSSHAWTTIRTF